VIVCVCLVAVSAVPVNRRCFDEAMPLPIACTSDIFMSMCRTLCIEVAMKICLDLNNQVLIHKCISQVMWPELEGTVAE
jgi:hypothetical protein